MLFSHSVVSDSFQPHGLQHARPPLSITNSQSLLRLMSIKSVMLTTGKSIALTKRTLVSKVGFILDLTIPKIPLLTKLGPIFYLLSSCIYLYFSSGHVWMWELECEESWVLKNWCFWTVVLEKTLESPLDCKEIQPIHSEGDQPWDFFGRNDAKAETPVLWPPHAKCWLIGKDSDAWRDWGQEEKGMTEDEMAGWHHWLDGRESEWTPGVGDGQAGLACCDSWGHKELDTTERLNWTELNWKGLENHR